MALQHNDHRPMVYSARERQMDEARVARIAAISFGVLWIVMLGLNMLSGY
jgi:hypothetical protein